MSLTQALSTAIAGLKVNQSGLALVAANVANAATPGYVRKTVNQVTLAGNDTGVSVNISGIQRELDAYVQRQLRAENSGAVGDRWSAGYAFEERAERSKALEADFKADFRDIVLLHN